MKKYLLALLTVLSLLLIVPTLTSAATFKDVPSGRYYYDAVEWGYKNKIVNGVGNGKFDPNRSVTNQEFLKMFVEYFKLKKNYTGHQNMFDEYYTTLGNYGALFDEYYRSEPISRGGVAALVAFSQNAYLHPFHDYSSYSLGDDSDKIITYMFANNLSKGVPTTSKNLVDRYDFYGTLTRADAVTFLYNLSTRGYKTFKVAPINQKFDGKSVRSFTSTNGVTAHVRTSDYKNYSLQFVYKDTVIGGYETGDGKTFASAKIGASYQRFNGENVSLAELKERNGKSLHNIIESFNNKVHGIYWVTIDPMYSEQITAMLDDQKANQLFINNLYVELINTYRAAYDEKPLKYHPDLALAAYLHSVDMSNNGYFSHTNLAGEGPSERVQKINPNLYAGENIAWNYSSIFTAHSGWINSPGHRSNMLHSDYEFVGFGEHNRYYTVNLH